MSDYTVVGNVVTEPVLRVVRDGLSVANFRVAQTYRRLDRLTGEWRDGDTLFLGVSCWRGLAENVHHSLSKGDPVIVRGRLNVRSYETKDGELRTAVEIDATAVGPDLSRGVAKLVRTTRRAAQDGAKPAVDQPAAVAPPADEPGVEADYDAA